MGISAFNQQNNTDSEFDEWFVSNYSNAINRAHGYILSNDQNDRQAVTRIINKTRKQSHLGSWGEKTIELLEGFIGKKNTIGEFVIKPNLNSLKRYYDLVLKHYEKQKKIDKGYRKQEEAKRRAQCWTCNNLYFNPDQWESFNQMSKMNLATSKGCGRYNSQMNAFRSYKSWLYDSWESQGILVQTTKRNFVDYD